MWLILLSKMIITRNLLTKRHLGPKRNSKMPHQVAPTTINSTNVTMTITMFSATIGLLCGFSLRFLRVEILKWLDSHLERTKAYPR